VKAAERLGGEILDLTARAIRLRTTADRPDDLRACLDLYLAALEGAPVTVERFEFDGVPSAVVRPLGVTRPKVILNGHLDVVPAAEAAFEPRVEGNRLIGRGSYDMKGPLAAVTAVFRETAPLAVPWWLTIVCDEEVGGKKGAARMAALGWEADLFLAAESTEMALSLQSKGVLRVEVGYRGRAAHGSAPWTGDSSVERVMAARDPIRLVIPEVLEEAWQTTASFTIIKGGETVNQVPDWCALSLDIRHVPEDDPEAIVAGLRRALPGYEIRVIDRYPPMVCREDNPHIATLREAVRDVTGVDPPLGREHGATDARYFSDRMDALIFGPAGAGLHGPDEWVSIPSLLDFAGALEAWARRLA
jgi:succinyl-diaminopimelate desuccinylase